jgi:hypothetical protein
MRWGGRVALLLGCRMGLATPFVDDGVGPAYRNQARGHAFILKSDRCRTLTQRTVPSLAVSSNLGRKIRETKPDAQTAPLAYTREVTTPPEPPGGPSACVYPVYHSVSPMR